MIGLHWKQLVDAASLVDIILATCIVGDVDVPVSGRETTGCALKRGERVGLRREADGCSGSYSRFNDNIEMPANQVNGKSWF